MKKLILTFLSSTATLVCLLAQPAGWNYSAHIEVTENSGTTLTDYQLKLILDTQTPIAAGQMDAAGNDIRFGTNCDTADLMYYWIESGINTPNTIIWVKLDTLAANSTQTMYMFYGNPSAAVASTIPGTFFGPHSSTDSVASGGAGGVTNSQRGFRFAPTQDILFADIGKREPNGTTRFVTLFDYVTQAILYQGQVSGPAAQYSYTPVTNPFWLTTGTQYVVELFQGSSDGYYFGTSSQIGQHLTYFDMRYCNSCTENTFPNNTLTNYHYGYPDFWYYTRNQASPEPTYTYTPRPVFSLGNDTTNCGTYTINNPLTGTTYMWNTGANTQHLTTDTSGNYFVHIDNTNWCTLVSDTVAVTINPVPGINLGADTTNCTHYTLDAGAGATTYLWNDSTTNQTLDISTTGIYSVEITNSFGCVNSDTAQVTIYGLPTVNLSLPLDSSCATDGLLALTGGTPAGGSYSGAGVSGGNFNPGIGAGTYNITYTYTDNNGCTDSTTDNLLVSACLFIDETVFGTLQIYPNPSTGIVYVQVSELPDNSTLFVYDLSGKVLVTKVMNNTTEILDIKGAPGIYLLELRTGSQSYRHKITIQN